MPVYDLVGTTLSSDVPRTCGLCGDFRKLSKAHVPPQVAGNNVTVMRAADVIVEGVRRPGRWSAGGMWVRGLCQECNTHAGTWFDVPYADFAGQVSRLATPTAQSLLVSPGGPPAAMFAPGLVSRAVIFGMFAINPRLRVLFPELAADLRSESSPGCGPIRWPSKLSLKVGKTHAGFPQLGVISSGVWAMRVLQERVVHWTFGDIVWPPLTWALVPADNDSERDGLGPQITQILPDVSEWLRYGPDRNAVDLRNLIGELPDVPHPLLARTNDWVEFLTRDGSDADSVVVFGRRQ